MSTDINNTLQLVEEEYELVYNKPSTMVDAPMHYCPGCYHGLVHKLLMEVVEEMDIQEQTIGVAPVGCSVFAYDYMDIDMQQAAHGRAAAVATGIKRLMPDKYVFTYQGDGDLAAIGIAETLHAINRAFLKISPFVSLTNYGVVWVTRIPLDIVHVSTTDYIDFTREGG